MEYFDPDPCAVYARKELEPLIEWGLRLRAFSICCDSIRAHLEEYLDE